MDLGSSAPALFRSPHTSRAAPSVGHRSSLSVGIQQLIAFQHGVPEKVRNKPFGPASTLGTTTNAKSWTPFAAGIRFARAPIPAITAGVTVAAACRSSPAMCRPAMSSNVSAVRRVLCGLCGVVQGSRRRSCRAGSVRGSRPARHSWKRPRHEPFAPLIVRNHDYGALRDRGMLRNRVLEIDRIDILAGDDHVRDPVTSR